MKVLVNRMPDKKEDCLFYREVAYLPNGKLGNIKIISKDCCSINNKKCSFKNESIFGGECRCLEVGLMR